jgi:hypothetical protein
MTVSYCRRKPRSSILSLVYEPGFSFVLQALRLRHCQIDTRSSKNPSLVLRTSRQQSRECALLRIQSKHRVWLFALQLTLQYRYSILNKPQPRLANFATNYQRVCTPPLLRTVVSGRLMSSRVENEQNRIVGFGRS